MPGNEIPRLGFAALGIKCGGGEKMGPRIREDKMGLISNPPLRRTDRRKKRCLATRFLDSALLRSE